MYNYDTNITTNLTEDEILRSIILASNNKNQAGRKCDEGAFYSPALDSLLITFRARKLLISKGVQVEK